MIKVRLMTEIILAAVLVSGCAKSGDNPTPNPVSKQGQERGGGDPAAVAFLHYSRQIGLWLTPQNSTLNADQIAHYQAVTAELSSEMDAVGNTPVAFVDEELYDVNGVSKVAVYSTNPQTIKVNRKGWNSLDLTQRYILSGLEVFGIIGIDSRYDVASLITSHLDEIRSKVEHMRIARCYQSWTSASGSFRRELFSVNFRDYNYAPGIKTASGSYVYGFATVYSLENVLVRISTSSGQPNASDDQNSGSLNEGTISATYLGVTVTCEKITH